MSHIVNIKTEVRDAAVVRTACQRLGLPEPVHGKTQLFSGEVEGLAVQLPDWVYPVVCDTASGQVKFDNFNGRWGDQRHFNKFLQIYAAEKVKIESRKRGNLCTEQALPDGSIKLTIQVTGGVSS